MMPTHSRSFDENILLVNIFMFWIPFCVNFQRRTLSGKVKTTWPNFFCYKVKRTCTSIRTSVGFNWTKGTLHFAKSIIISNKLSLLKNVTSMLYTFVSINPLSHPIFFTKTGNPHSLSTSISVGMQILALFSTTVPLYASLHRTYITYILFFQWDSSPSNNLNTLTNAIWPIQQKGIISITINSEYFDINMVVMISVHFCDFWLQNNKLHGYTLQILKNYVSTE